MDQVQKAVFEPQTARQAGDRIALRQIRYFSHHWRRIPDSWAENPQTSVTTAAVHWSLIPDFEREQGDIKWIWEPSRFDWVYPLARAYASSLDNTYAEAFWGLFEDWRAHNPPNLGVNWKCGQEASFRMFALAFAAGAFRGARASTPERAGALWQTIRALAERVEVAIDYALSQRNNHGLTESVALYLAGHCLPEEPKSQVWSKTGKALFESQIRDQFFDDGGYIQHSFVYERLALRVASIFCFTAHSVGDSLSPEVREKLTGAVKLMANVVDPASGMAPNYGANDGTNIFALSGCNVLDFRPSVQTLSVLLEDQGRYPPGPWDEELAWLSLCPKAQLKVTTASFGAPASGYYVLRGAKQLGLLRCHTYTSRPSHADLLSLDLWMDGVNVIPDAGTFQYADANGIGSELRKTAVHSTVEVNGHSQMLEYGRFLWLEWTRSKVIEFQPERGVFVGEHYGYERSDGVIHRRSVFVREGDWLIVDDLLLVRPERVNLSLRWRLFKDGDWVGSDRGAQSGALGIGVRVTSASPIRTELMRGSLDNTETIESRYYGDRNTVDLLKSVASTKQSLRWLTTIGRSQWLENGSGDFLWHDLVVNGAPASPIRIA